MQVFQVRSNRTPDDVQRHAIAVSTSQASAGQRRCDHRARLRYTPYYKEYCFEPTAGDRRKETVSDRSARAIHARPDAATDRAFASMARARAWQDRLWS